MKSYSDAFCRQLYIESAMTVKENHDGVYIRPILHLVMILRTLARLQSF
ncbi:hypothetical protein [Mycoplasmopsis mustelae]|nr:hypothetical protein [Mycoplasmopsis mustelae]